VAGRHPAVYPALTPRPVLSCPMIAAFLRHLNAPEYYFIHSC